MNLQSMAMAEQTRTAQFTKLVEDKENTSQHKEQEIVAHRSDYEDHLRQRQEQQKNIDHEMNRLEARLARALGSNSFSSGMPHLLRAEDVEVGDTDEDLIVKLENTLVVGKQVEVREGVWRSSGVVVERILMVSDDPREQAAHSASRQRDRVANPMKQVVENLRKQKQDERRWRDAAVEELRLVGRLRHPRLAQYYGAVIHDGPQSTTAMVEALVEPGLIPLLSHLEEFDASEVYVIGKDICRGLEYLHSRGVAHKHLRAENVWLEDGDDRYIAKLGGFFAARVSCRAQITPFVPSEYCPQLSTLETKDREAADPRKGDIFALGSLLCLLFTRSDSCTEDVHDRVSAIENEDLRYVIMQCVIPDPEMRPTATVVHRGLAAVEAGEEVDMTTWANDPSLQTTAVDAALQGDEVEESSPIRLETPKQETARFGAESTAAPTPQEEAGSSAAATPGLWSAGTTPALHPPRVSTGTPAPPRSPRSAGPARPRPSSR